MSDSHGGTPPVHPSPGEDRPAGPGAEAEGVPVAGSPAPGLVETQPSAADESTLPSEQRGTRPDGARADDQAHNRGEVDAENP